jgi:chromosome segregation ATPase
MMHRLRDSEDENRVLADALAASRKAVTKRELESAKLREEFKSIADANGDNDDAKMELIASLFDKVDSLTTRLASVTTTPNAAGGASPKADGLDSLRRELQQANEELARVSMERDRMQMMLKTNSGNESGDGEMLEKLKKQLRAAQDAKLAALADAAAFAAERDALSAEVQRLRREVKAISYGSPVGASERTSHVIELEQLLVEAQNAINLLSDDRENLLGRLRDLEDSAGDGNIVAARQAARHAAEAAQEVAHEAEQTMMESLSKDEMIQALQEELETQRDIAEQRADDVEKLKSIVRDLDAQREGLAQKLRSAYGNLRDAGPKNGFGESSMAAKMAMLEEECTRLQDEADAAAESLDEARERAMREGAAAEEARRLAATAEAKVYNAAQQRDSAEAHARSAEEHLREAVEKENKLSIELAQYREELAVVSDDLVAMTKEQQVVNSELLRATSERDGAWIELRQAKAAQSAAEANAKAKQKELDDVIKAYQELGLENRRVVADMDNMERDLRRAKAALEASEMSLTQATEKVKLAEAENRAYSSDLQAYQRQVDNLTHLLENSQRNKSDEADSYEALTTKLEASKAMLFDMERAREMARRETAAAEANLLVARSRLTDAQGDNETLKHKLRLESNRTRELESLVSALRTHEHQVEIESGDTSQRSELLRERVGVLQEQNSGLLKQVQTLGEQRKTFETELERLRAIIEGTDAAAPRTSGVSSTSALMHAEKLVKEQTEEIENLKEALKSLQDKCEALETAQYEADMSASNARREANAIARREAESRAQLDGMRGELRVAKEALNEVMNEGPSHADIQNLRSRLQDAERRASNAEAALESLGQSLRSPVSSAANEEARVLREENDRLLDLLSNANDDLNVARQLIDANGYADSSASDLLVREQVRAAEERTQQVEDDFNRLVEQMSQMQHVSDSELETRLRELEEENAQLRENLDGTEMATRQMQDELQRISEEYAALASTLNETLSAYGDSP